MIPFAGLLTLIFELGKRLLADSHSCGLAGRTEFPMTASLTGRRRCVELGRLCNQQQFVSGSRSHLP